MKMISRTSVISNVTTDDELTDEGTPPNIYHTDDEYNDNNNNNNNKSLEPIYQPTSGGLRYRGKDERLYEKKILNQEYNESETLDDSETNGDNNNIQTSFIQTNKKKKSSFTLLRVGSAFVDLSSMVPEEEDDDDQDSFRGNY
jgi:hypothetical protein